MKIADIRTILPQIVSEIAEINYAKLIMGESDLTKFLKDLNKDEKNSLFFVIPEYTKRGTDDSSIEIANCQLLIMSKFSDRDTHEDYLDIVQNAQEAIDKLEIWMLDHKEQNPCGVFKRLKDESFVKTAVDNLISCHGFSMIFNVEE